MSTKEIQSVDHIFLSIRNIYKIINDIRKEDKETLKSVKKSIREALQQKDLVLTYDTLFDIIDICPTRKNQSLLSACEKQLKQIELKKHHLDDPEISETLYRELIFLTLKAYNEVNISQREKIDKKLDDIFELLPYLRKQGLDVDKPKDLDEPIKKESKKESKKKKKKKVQL